MEIQTLLGCLVVIVSLVMPCLVYAVYALQDPNLPLRFPSIGWNG